ncbi:MAG: DUF72 domain-containing protein [Sphingobacteriales bacterium]|nr:MAG: DUF72 domain-containing protein [Sphingobacteriales bacterium]
MDFGKVADPGKIEFRLPKDAPQTRVVLEKHKKDKPLEVFVGCAKWNKQDLRGFYPPYVKDASSLNYYASQFNSVELNATFYQMPAIQDILRWVEQTPAGFKFFPKITNSITHFRRLLNAEEKIEDFCNAVANFEKRLGMVFMQLHDNFQPKDFDRLEHTLQHFPKGIPLAVEVRNEAWFSDPAIFNDFANLLEKKKVANIIVDTAGRRDILHMRLTSPVAFIRYVGANHATDTERLDDWVLRIKKWQKQGLKIIVLKTQLKQLSHRPKDSTDLIS